MTTPANTRDRGACRVCGQRTRLDVDGRVAEHGIPWAPAIECDGTGRLPAPQGATR